MLIFLFPPLFIFFLSVSHLYFYCPLCLYFFNLSLLSPCFLSSLFPLHFLLTSLLIHHLILLVSSFSFPCIFFLLTFSSPSLFFSLFLISLSFLLSFFSHYFHLFVYVSHFLSLLPFFLCTLFSSLLLIYSVYFILWSIAASCSCGLLMLWSLYPPLLSAPGSGPMFRSTTVAVDSADQSRPEIVQNGSNIHPSNTTLGTSKSFYPLKKACTRLLKYFMSMCLVWVMRISLLILRDSIACGLLQNRWNISVDSRLWCQSFHFFSNV